MSHRPRVRHLAPRTSNNSHSSYPILRSTRTRTINNHNAQATPTVDISFGRSQDGRTSSRRRHSKRFVWTFFFFFFGITPTHSLLIPVILHYDNYINFTGEAFIKFPSTLLAREATQKLRGSQFSGIPLERPVLVVDEDVKPSPTSTPQKESHLPSPIQSASVIITGVPYTWTHPNILSYLDAFRPEFLDAPEESVTRITVYVVLYLLQSDDLNDSRQRSESYSCRSMAGETCIPCRGPPNSPTCQPGQNSQSSQGRTGPNNVREAHSHLHCDILEVLSYGFRQVPLDINQYDNPSRWSSSSRNSLSPCRTRVH